MKIMLASFLLSSGQIRCSWPNSLKHAVWVGSLLCLVLGGCTRSYFSNWIVEEVSKPNSTRVTAVRLTPTHTILDVQFTNEGKYFYTHKNQVLRIGYICISPDTKLVAASGNRRYSLIKAEGIHLLPHVVKVAPFEQISFRLYFERLEKGVERFAWIDTIVKDAHTFHYEFPDLHVDNPIDDSPAR